MELLESGSVPSAVFAASDPIALGALNAAKEQGFKVPGDISFIGIVQNICFYDIHFFKGVGQTTQA